MYNPNQYPTPDNNTKRQLERMIHAENRMIDAIEEILDAWKELKRECPFLAAAGIQGYHQMTSHMITFESNFGLGPSTNWLRQEVFSLEKEYRTLK